MEIDITQFFKDAAPRDYSASQMELGRDAGKITWGHAMEDAGEYNFLDTEEKLAEARDYFKGFGAWDEEEIAAWTPQELNALVIQEISAAMREAGWDDGNLDGELDWEEYQRMSEAGQVSGRIFKGDDDTIYFYLGS